jgi:hypothetical protein
MKRSKWQSVVTVERDLPETENIFGTHEKRRQHDEENIRECTGDGKHTPKNATHSSCSKETKDKK